MSDGPKTPLEGGERATFEERLALLADLVGKLEGGQLGLSESIAAYERGVTLVRTLHAELLDVEQRVSMLTTASRGDGASAVPEADSPTVADSGASRRKAGSRAAKASSRAAEPSKSSFPSADPPRGRDAGRLPGMDDGGAEA